MWCEKGVSHAQIRLGPRGLPGADITRANAAEGRLLLTDSVIISMNVIGRVWADKTIKAKHFSLDLPLYYHINNNRWCFPHHSILINKNHWEINKCLQYNIKWYNRSCDLRRPAPCTIQIYFVGLQILLLIYDFKHIFQKCFLFICS